jgi:hypothetical protein
MENFRGSSCSNPDFRCVSLSDNISISTKRPSKHVLPVLSNNDTIYISREYDDAASFDSDYLQYVTLSFLESARKFHVTTHNLFWDASWLRLI